MKILALCLLVLVALVIAACSSPGKTESTQGGYAVVPPHYQLVDNQLCASDGKDWYQLQTPYFPAGNMSGADVGFGEVWIKVGGGRIRQYHRTPETFRDQHKQPVFVSY